MEIAEARRLYVDLLMRGLLNELYPDSEYSTLAARGPVKRAVAALFARAGYEIVRPVPASGRAEGKYWPKFAHTMIGRKRLENVAWCVEQTLRHGVPGDFIEAGVWRGGACILARGIYKAYGEQHRRVLAADSFQGLPAPSHKADAATKAGDLHAFSVLAVPLAEVQQNFAVYGLLDEQVVFLKGWFKDTLPALPAGQKFAVVRIDGDMYASTKDAIEALYPRLSPGGYIIIDDYQDFEACKKAVDEYRAAHAITAPLVPIDWTGVYWHKTA